VENEFIAPRIVDVPARVDELRLLKNGWLDGRGLRPSPTELDWFVASFQTGFSGDLPLPYVYPTESGGLRLEWETVNLDVSVDIDLSAKTGELHVLNRASDEDRSEQLHFEDNGWSKLRGVVSGEGLTTQPPFYIGK
jgi:hypothetical protein